VSGDHLQKLNSYDRHLAKEAIDRALQLFQSNLSDEAQKVWSGRKPLIIEEPGFLQNVNSTATFGGQIGDWGMIFTGPSQPPQNELDPDHWMGAGQNLTDYPYPPNHEARPKLQAHLQRWFTVSLELNGKRGGKGLADKLTEEEARALWEETREP
jgi:hypothetical protein